MDDKKIHSTKIHYILIDDDELVHMMWKMNDSQKNINSLHFLSAHDFYEFLENNDYKIPNLKSDFPDTHFYIDQELKHDTLTGQKIARNLYNHGIRNLYLCTGHHENALEGDLSFLKGIVGKAPPQQISSSSPS